MPFPIEAIQVDGGSGFKVDFETERQRRSIALFERPPRAPRLNGHGERNNGAWRYESCAIWDLPNDDLDDINQWLDAFAEQFNIFRPYQALGGQTPAKHLANRKAKKTSRLMCPEPGQDVNSLHRSRIALGLQINMGSRLAPGRPLTGTTFNPTRSSSPSPANRRGLHETHVGLQRPGVSRRRIVTDWRNSCVC